MRCIIGEFIDSIRTFYFVSCRSQLTNVRECVVSVFPSAPCDYLNGGVDTQRRLDLAFIRIGILPL